MKEVSLSGSKRENVGKKDAKALRNAGNVPAVLYGGSEQVAVSLKENDVNKLIFTPHVYLVNLDIDGNAVKAIVQDYQQDPVTDRIVHVDFLEVTDSKPVKVKLPVNIEGSSPGVMQGGKLQQVLRKLTVKGLLKDLPETIGVDISKLNIGDAVRVEQMEVEGLSFLEASSALIVSVKMARGAKKDDGAEEEGVEEAAAAE